NRAVCFYYRSPRKQGVALCCIGKIHLGLRVKQRVIGNLPDDPGGGTVENARDIATRRLLVGLVLRLLVGLVYHLLYGEMLIELANGESLLLERQIGVITDGLISRL